MEKQKYSLVRNTFIRFAIVGVLSNILNFAVYVIVFLLSTNIVFSSVLGYSIGLFNTYLLGRIWVFNSEQPNQFKEIVKFLVVYFIGGAGMTLIIVWLNNELNIDYKASWIGGAIFAIVNNYLGSKYIVFKKHKKGLF
jgi:putative flippase GtrA